MTDLAAARRFVLGHARLLERRRLAHLLGTGSPGAVVDALAAYRNDDHGFGALEPDLRTDSSQTAPTLYALGILHEAGAGDSPLAAGALDWLATVANDDGGVPFVLPSAGDAPRAPWFAIADDPPSSLLITAGLAAMAHRLGLDHPWLGGATAYCWERLRDVPLGEAYTLRYVLDLLDAVPDREPADAELDLLAERFPADGVLPVDAGVEGEVLRALDVAPRPDHAARRLFPDALIEGELDALAAGQRDDGGWDFTWLAWNPAAAFESRGMVSVEALRTLRAYGRL